MIAMPICSLFVCIGRPTALKTPARPAPLPSAPPARRRGLAARAQVIKVGRVVWLHARNGADYTEGLPGMRKALRRCTTRGLRNHRRRVCLVDLRGAAQFLAAYVADASAGRTKAGSCSWRSTRCTRTAWTCGDCH